MREKVGEVPRSLSALGEAGGVALVGEAPSAPSLLRFEVDTAALADAGGLLGLSTSRSFLDGPLEEREDPAPSRAAIIDRAKEAKDAAAAAL